MVNTGRERERDIYIYSGWWLGHPSEKYGPSIGMIIPNIWENKNVPNHQPVYIYIYTWAFSIVMGGTPICGWFIREHPI